MCPLYNLISKTAIEILRNNRKVQHETVVFFILCNHYEKAQQVDLLKQLRSQKEKDSNNKENFFPENSQVLCFSYLRILSFQLCQHPTMC